MQMNSLPRRESAPRPDLAPVRHQAWADDARINARRPPFDRITISLHWATVLLVLTLFASAWLHALAAARHDDVAPALLQIHRSFGVIVWVMTVLRLAWRLSNATLPPFPITMTRLQRATVKSSEYGLYALLLAQPVTGLLTTIFGGRPFALFIWRFPPLAARNESLQAAFHLAHELGAWTLAVLILGHAAAALFHHFVARDDVLECMAPVTRRHAPNATTISQPT
jgi:cytochrome b561